MKKYKVILNYKVAVEIRAEDEQRAISSAMDAVDEAIDYCCSGVYSTQRERQWWDAVKEVDDK